MFSPDVIPSGARDLQWTIGGVGRFLAVEVRWPFDGAQDRLGMTFKLPHFSRFTPHASRFTLCLLLLASPAGAQVTSRPVREGSMPMSAGSGPVSEMSTNTGRGSRPVSGDGSVRDSAADRLGGNSVRGSATGDIRSGPVSAASVGSVHTRVPPAVSVMPPPEYFPEGYPDNSNTEADDLQSLADRLREVEPLPREPESSATTAAPEGESEQAPDATIENQHPPPADDGAAAVADGAAEPVDESAADPEPAPDDEETEAAPAPEAP